MRAPEEYLIHISPFKIGQVEAQGGKVTFPGSYGFLVGELRLKPDLQICRM